MRLFESILAANARAAANQAESGDAISIATGDLPVAVLSCLDSRLNVLLPEALGLPESQLIWLRNAGNIITGSFTSTMRSLALACLVKGAKEVAIIGHTDCQVGKLSAMDLLERLAKAGIDRHQLPANLVEYFGLFGTERQNVMRAVDFARASPLLGAKIPVHGLLVDTRTGRLEWIVNGYQDLNSAAGRSVQVLQKADAALDAFGAIGNLAMGAMKFPDSRIGELTKSAQDWLHKAEQVAGALEAKLGPPAAAKPPEPPPLPKVPPRARPK